MQNRALIRKIQQGEAEQLDILIERHYQAIYAFCYRRMGDGTTAYDITQEVFLRLTQSIGTYSHEGKLQSYLFTIAVNLCNDYYRKHKHSALETELDAFENLPAHTYEIDRLETADAVKAALDSLPTMQKDVMILRFYHDLKLSDIARITGSSVSTTKSRLKQGLDKLRVLLKEESF